VSGHFDLRVRSSQKMASEGVTASLALGAINRSVLAMAEVEHLTRLCVHARECLGALQLACD
jgi:hypothetical protein